MGLDKTQTTCEYEEQEFGILPVPLLICPFSEETREQDERCNILGLDKTQTACECEEQEFSKLPVQPDIRTSSNVLAKQK